MFDKLICIEMDANAKIGNEYIESDPNCRSSNGDLLIQMCERNNLIICNTTDLCEVVSTRQIITVNGIERSIFDYNPIIGRFNIVLNNKLESEKQRYEIFNFKDPEGVIKFNELT